MVPSRTRSTEPTLHSRELCRSAQKAKLSHSPWKCGRAKSLMIFRLTSKSQVSKITLDEANAVVSPSIGSAFVRCAFYIIWIMFWMSISLVKLLGRPSVGYTLSYEFRRGSGFSSAFVVRVPPNLRRKGGWVKITNSRRAPKHLQQRSK